MTGEPARRSGDGQGGFLYADWIQEWDLLGRLTATEDPLGNRWTWTWDEAGRLVEILGPAGSHRRFQYDARHRPTAVVVDVAGSSDPTWTIAGCAIEVPKEGWKRGESP